MQHLGNLVVEDHREISGQVTGTTIVKARGRLVARGQLSGGLIIEEGGKAVVHGQVSRNVVNGGTLELYGQVCGRIIGNPPVNAVRAEQVVGRELETPFRGQSVSWSSGS